VIELSHGRGTSVEVAMVGLGRLAAVIILLTCLSSERQAEASTVSVTGALDLNGQSFALVSGETLNFDISGPISGAVIDGFVVFVGITGAPTVTTSSIIINNAPFIGAQVFATVNGASVSADTNNCSIAASLIRFKGISFP
jgi:hypothetical protein